MTQSFCQISKGLNNLHRGSGDDEVVRETCGELVGREDLLILKKMF